MRKCFHNIIFSDVVFSSCSEGVNEALCAGLVVLLVVSFVSHSAFVFSLFDSIVRVM